MQFTTEPQLAPDSATSAFAPGAFTVLRVDGIATKRLSLRGREVAIDAAPNLARGAYRVEVAGSVDQLKGHIERLSTSEALVWGLPAHPAGDVIPKADLAKLGGSAPATTIARTRGHFAFAPRMSWLMLDADYVPPGATLASLRDILLAAAPGLADLSMLSLSSSSANIYLRGQRTPLRGLTGARFYVPVADGRQIPELGRRLIDRLVLAGLGRAEVSKTGQVLFRTSLDGSVWQPERVDFAAGAHVEPPLEQRREIRTWRSESTLQLDDARLPALTADERTRLADIKNELRAAVKAEAAKARDVYKAERTAAGQPVAWSEDGGRLLLDGGHTIKLHSGELVTVDDLLADPTRYHGQACADPLEPEYRDDSRIAVIKLDGVANIYSQAHGGMLYLLRHSAQEDFEADPSVAPPLEVQPIAPLPTEGERLAALTGDADSVFLAEAMSLRGDLWEHWARLDAAAATHDPLAGIFDAVFAAARSAPADRPPAFRFAVRAAMTGDPRWTALSRAEQDLLVKAAHSLLRGDVSERREPRLVTAGESQTCIIDHVLPQGALVGLVGLPGQGKSFLGLEMAARVAGRDGGTFGSLKVNVHGPVFYLLSEDALGFRARKERWEQVNGPTPDLYLFDEVPLLTGPVADLLHFVRAARAQAGADPVLVVLDIFADSLAGADENLAAVMVPALRRARVVGRLLNATVLLVHHSPKAQPEDARGSVAFRAALDVMNAVTQDPRGNIHFKPVKYRSAPLREEILFHISDAVLRPGAARGEVWLDDFSEEAARALAGRVVHRMGPITRDDLRAGLIEAQPEWFDPKKVGTDKAKNRRNRAIRDAIEAGYIEETAGRRLAPGATTPPTERPADIGVLLT